MEVIKTPTGLLTYEVNVDKYHANIHLYIFENIYSLEPLLHTFNTLIHYKYEY